MQRVRACEPTPLLAPSFCSPACRRGQDQHCHAGGAARGGRQHGALRRHPKGCAPRLALPSQKQRACLMAPRARAALHAGAPITRHHTPHRLALASGPSCIMLSLVDSLSNILAPLPGRSRLQGGLCGPHEGAGRRGHRQLQQAPAAAGCAGPTGCLRPRLRLRLHAPMPSRGTCLARGLAHARARAIPSPTHLPTHLPGLSVRELTGDMSLTKKEMAETQASAAQCQHACLCLPLCLSASRRARASIR